MFQFVIATSDYTVKFNFDFEANGAQPQTGLSKGKNGNLYGITQYGGTNNEGVIFEYDPANSKMTKKFDFSNKQNETGKYPQALLIQAADGKLYGMTYTGAVADVGGVFQFDPQTNAYKKQFDFHTSEIGNMPIASLIYANDKMLYGVTETGGLRNQGTIFKYDPVLEVYSKKFDFTNMTTGEMPIGGIVQANDGKIYGTTSMGGTHDKGILFQFDPLTDGYKAEFEFDSINGSLPLGELMQASDGKIYGMTSEGGVNNTGVLFQYDPVTSKLVKKYDFKSDGNGERPEGGLVEADGGKLLGVTTIGGTNTSGSFSEGLGVVFQYDLASGTYTKKADFESVNGILPNGTLVKAADGNYYGLATRGGLLTKESPDGSGSIFQYDPVTSTISSKYKFDGLVNGKLPNGSLLSASDGNLYGTTNYGGSANYGVLFQFNPGNTIFTKKMDFTKSVGMLPERCKLVEISLTNSIIETQQSTLQVNVYPNPGKDQVVVLLNEQVSNATLKVYTLTGQVVLEKTQLNGNKFQLQIENLARGTYFIELNENGADNHTLNSRNKLIKN